MRLEYTFEKPIIEEFLETAKTGKRKIRGKAIHPCKTVHPHEWIKIRQYAEPFLKEAAKSLVGKPLNLNHEGEDLQGCVITKAYWDEEESALCYVAEISEAVANMIESVGIKNVSVGIEWQKPGGGIIVQQDGSLLPYAFDFSHLALVTPDYEAGDLMSTVELWETVCKNLKDANDLATDLLIKAAKKQLTAHERVKKAKLATLVYDEQHKGWVLQG